MIFTIFIIYLFIGFYLLSLLVRFVKIVEGHKSTFKAFDSMREELGMSIVFVSILWVMIVAYGTFRILTDEEGIEAEDLELMKDLLIQDWAFWRDCDPERTY